jgi:hypothetical protein
METKEAEVPQDVADAAKAMGFLRKPVVQHSEAWAGRLGVIVPSEIRWVNCGRSDQPRKLRILPANYKVPIADLIGPADGMCGPDVIDLERYRFVTRDAKTIELFFSVQDFWRSDRVPFAPLIEDRIVRVIYWAECDG